MVPTVAADDPLAALYQIVIQSLEFLADGTALGSALGDALAELRSNLLGLVGILSVLALASEQVRAVNPLL